MRGCNTCASPRTARQNENGAVFSHGCDIVVGEVYEESVLVVETTVTNETADPVIAEVAAYLDGVEVASATVDVPSSSDRRVPLSAFWGEVTSALDSGGVLPDQPAEFDVQTEIIDHTIL